LGPIHAFDEQRYHHLPRLIAMLRMNSASVNRLSSPWASRSLHLLRLRWSSACASQSVP